MRILVTGVNGFVGRHLTTELNRHNHTVIAFEHPDAGTVAHVSEVYYGDICDKPTLVDTVKQSKPDACIHLAAIAFVPDGNSNPHRMMAVNVDGTANLLDAIRDYNQDCRALIVSTAHVYGQDKGSEPVTEDTELTPASIYAESKAKADIASLAYAREHGMHIMTARPHNHIGPGQSPKFVVPSFAQQAKAIATEKQEAVIKVGNLESERDFTDVRDVVRAYRMIIESGTAAKAYNIASDKLYKIGDLLHMLCKLAGIDPDIQIDDSLFRPTDYAASLDTSKIKQDTGWKTEIDLQTTLTDIYQDISL